MKKCYKCDADIEESRNFCPFCGAYVEVKKQTNKSKFNFGEAYEKPSNNQETPNDTGSVGYWLIGFFVPIVGFILYALWLRVQPKNAKKCLYGALTSVIVSIIFTILLFILLILGIVMMSHVVIHLIF